MKAGTLTYRPLRRYKYQLLETYAHDTGLVLDFRAQSGGGWVVLETSGVLVVRKGYCWDGPSGPTIDTPSFMRGSLVHDALYQLMREGKLEPRYRKVADQLLRDICAEAGMWPFRVRYVYWTVRRYGEKHTRERPVPETRIAP